MRKSLLSFFIGLIFLGVFFYFVENITPWNKEVLLTYLEEFDISKGADFEFFIEESLKAGILVDFINIPNLIFLFSLISASFIGFFMSVHMLIDKLFFKKFYEQPNHKTAFRRAIWLPIIVAVLVFIKLFGGFVSINIGFFVFVLLVIIAAEYLFTRGGKKVDPEVNTEGESLLSVDD